ncbi:hypothetical protein Hanom_Chr01g00056891 [Helianthus anomalus]
MQQKRISNNFRSPFSLASQQFLTPISAAHSTREPVVIMPTSSPLARVRFSDLIPYVDVPTDGYLRAVENLSGSFKQRIAVVTPPFHRRRSGECHSSGMAFGARRWLAVLQCQCKSYGPEYIRHWRYHH